MGVDKGRFQFSPKFRKFRLEIKWNGPFRFGPTKIFGTIFEGGWSTLKGPVISVGWTEMSLSI